MLSISFCCWLSLAQPSLFFTTHRSLPAQQQGERSFAPDLVRHGAELAALGYCASCHTAEGGKPFAGGRPLATPFGTIFGTNISPDPDTGIGAWSQAAFSRAMREGIDRSGHDLYPAFPYDHFAKLTDDDLGALYAFLMTRAPVHARNQANQLAFPFGFRPLLAGWKLLFLNKAPVPTDPTKSPEWNRGAYLVEALTHCSACHYAAQSAWAPKSPHTGSTVARPRIGGRRR